jgi:hypothetical protein
MENRNTDQDNHLQWTVQCLTTLLLLPCVCPTESNVCVMLFLYF